MTHPAENDALPSKAAQAAHRAFHDAWGGPAKPLNLYTDSPIWEQVAEAVLATRVIPPAPTEGGEQ